MSRTDDPYFFDFANRDYFLQKRLQWWRMMRQETFDVYDKHYDVGCFQALVLDRLSPGWKQTFTKMGKFLDQLIADLIPLTEQEKETISNQINLRYEYDKVAARHAPLIAGRDDAYTAIRNRKGRDYIIDFYSLGVWPRPENRRKKFSIGNTIIYREGIKDLQIERVLLRTEDTPIEQNQAWYMKWVDTEAKKGEKGYDLKFSRKEGDDIYYDLVLKTHGFSLKAPKIQLKERPTRVKIILLSKVKS